MAARADEELLARPERFLEYLVERMLAGHEQDDDVTVLVMHVPAGDRGDPEGERPGRRRTSHSRPQPMVTSGRQAG